MAHVGYYLIDEGRESLINELLNKKISNIKKHKNREKSIVSLSFINLFFSVIISGLLGYRLNIKIDNLSVSFIAYFLLIIIIKSLFGKINQYISGKIIKPKFKMGTSKTYIEVPYVVKNYIFKINLIIFFNDLYLYIIKSFYFLIYMINGRVHGRDAPVDVLTSAILSA